MHTKGPWRFEDDADDFDDMGRFVGADGTIVCSFGDDTTYYPTAGSPPEDADRRLIASAPDLLEALKLCAAVCAGETINKNGLIAALESARAAIAKATGEQ
jgi:hypothetical protein